MKDEIRSLQAEFDRAELDGDTAKLRQLIADDFQSIGPRGYLLDKEAWIGRHTQFRYLALETSDVDVRLYGGAAVVREVQKIRARFRGEEMEHTMRVGHVWVRQDEAWRLAAIQFSPFTPEAASARAS
jgi:hypothetical protein